MRKYTIKTSGSSSIYADVHTNNKKTAMKIARDLCLEHSHTHNQTYIISSVYLSEDLEADPNSYSIMRYEWESDTDRITKTVF